MAIQETNPWTKVLDGVLGEIPVIGMLSGYVLHPVYSVTRKDGSTVMRLVKEPAFFETKYRIERVAVLTEAEEIRALLSLITAVLLEKNRG
jgi:hypothetical protein